MHLVRRHNPVVARQSIMLILRTGPAGVLDAVKNDLSKSLDFESPADVVHNIFGSIDEFGRAVRHRLITRDGTGLTPQYMDFLTFVSQFCSNPDPARWAILTLRAAARDALCARVLRKDAPPQPKDKPVVVPPAAVTMPPEVLANVQSRAKASASKAPRAVVPVAGVRADDNPAA